MTINLEGFVSEVTSLTPTEDALLTFLDKGSYKYQNVNKFLAKAKGNLDNALHPRGVLMLPAHTLGWAYILGFKAQQENLQNCGGVENFVLQCQNFMAKADHHQLRHLGKPVGDIVRGYCREMRRAGRAEVMLPVLQAAMHICVGESRHMLTTAHVEFMHSCVDTGHYAEALPLAENTFVDIHKGSLQYADNLRYHYYAGLVFCGYKRWKEALSCFLNAIAAPSEAVSAVQLAAFKKYVLTSLLAYGRFVDLPKFTSGVVQRNLPKMCPAYVKLTKAFRKGRTESNDVCTNHAERFAEDKNFGLVQQVLNSIPQWKLRELPQVYVNITLENVANIVDDIENAAQARAELEVMIAANEINATIDQNGVVRFSTDDLPAGGIPRLMRGMEGRIREIHNLCSSTKKVSDALRTNPANIKKQMQSSPGGGGNLSMLDADAAQAMLLQQQEYMG